MDFLPLRRSFSTKIPKKIFFWPKPFYYLPWHGFEGWFGEKVPGSGPGSRFKRAYLKKGRFLGEKVSALRGYKMVKFWDFWPEIWYGPMIPPLFLTFGKKIGAGLLLLNKPVPTCQIFEAKVIGLAIYAIQNFSQNLMGRWVMSVQYEFDQFRKWNFWNGGQKTEKTLKNGIVLTLIIIFFSCFIKWPENLRNGFPTPENVLLDPRITVHFKGSVKWETQSASTVQLVWKPLNNNYFESMYCPHGTVVNVYVLCLYLSFFGIYGYL